MLIGSSKTLTSKVYKLPVSILSFEFFVCGGGKNKNLMRRPEQKSSIISKWRSEYK